jgi:hypothetical protein
MIRTAVELKPRRWFRGASVAHLGYAIDMREDVVACCGYRRPLRRVVSGGPDSVWWPTTQYPKCKKCLRLR